MVKSARKLIGATNPLEAEPGTIRGDFAVQVRAAGPPWLRLRRDTWLRSRARAPAARCVTEQGGAGPPALPWSTSPLLHTAPSCILICHRCVLSPPFLPSSLCLLSVPSSQVGRNVVHGSDSTENGERETGEPSPPAPLICFSAARQRAICVGPYCLSTAACALQLMTHTCDDSSAGTPPCPPHCLLAALPPPPCLQPCGLARTAWWLGSPPSLPGWWSRVPAA